MPMNDEDKVMLCLAALTYRGFSSPYHGELHDERLREAIVGDSSDVAKKKASLTSLVPQIGRWKLEWGPASYRMLSSTFDDAMMFVAKEEDEERYAVAVRGTNPISGFDWLFGDLWVCEKLPWPYPPEGPALSLSTALGLHILQNLRWDASDDGRRARPRFEWIGKLVETISEEIGGLRLATEPWFEFGDSRAVDQRTLERLIAPLAERWDSAKSNDTLEPLRRAAARLSKRTHLKLYDWLEDGIGVQAKLQQGQDLLGFLKELLAKERGPAITIDVTGHSKGGALSPAVALWLIETRSEWDPHKRATVRCWAFAGPTPGNAAFTKRFIDQFEKDNENGEKRFTRVVNRLDIVPRAFDPQLLGEVPSLYEPDTHCPLPLEGLVKLVAETTGGYSHLKSESSDILRDILLEPQQKKSGWFLDHVIHHHLDGYFEAAGLSYRVPNFFAPFG